MGYDAVIVGGSFAGLSVAKEISSGNILIIDRKKIGTHRTSTCGMPLELARRLGCSKSIIQTFNLFSFSTPSLERTIKVDHPYCTVDYYKFCELLRKGSNADFIHGEVEKIDSDRVITRNGTYRADYIIDASGPLSRIHKLNFKKNRSLAFGIETTVDFYDPVISKRISFYFDHKILKKGVCWIFPVGKKARMGVASYTLDTRLMDALKSHLLKYNTDINRDDMSGGFIACKGLEKPVVDGIFLVGDSGGQTLPLTAEGIRNAVINGERCGFLVNSAIDGKLKKTDIVKQYSEFIHRSKFAHRSLLLIEKLITTLPQSFLELGIRAVCKRPIRKFLEKLYMDS